jgi:hypothetical protein
MENLNEIFKNVINDMNHWDMAQYLGLVTSENDLKKLLFGLDDMQKAEIIDKVMQTEIESIMAKITNLGETISGEEYLLKLEGRLHMLNLTMLIASHLDDIGLIARTHNNINLLFIEYRQKGGKNMFYGKNHNGFE